MIETLEIIIWDREFTLPVEYDCYEDETVTKGQIKALKSFVTHKEWLTKAKKSTEDYCRKEVMADDENQKKGNIFSYIKPDYLFVKRDAANSRVALMCKYRYDMEHGLAIVFSSKGEITVGIQDIIL